MSIRHVTMTPIRQSATLQSVCRSGRVESPRSGGKIDTARERARCYPGLRLCLRLRILDYQQVRRHLTCYCIAAAWAASPTTSLVTGSFCKQANATHTVLRKFCGI